MAFAIEKATRHPLKRSAPEHPQPRRFPPPSPKSSNPRTSCIVRKLPEGWADQIWCLCPPCTLKAHLCSLSLLGFVWKPIGNYYAWKNVAFNGQLQLWLISFTPIWDVPGLIGRSSPRAALKRNRDKRN